MNKVNRLINIFDQLNDIVGKGAKYLLLVMAFSLIFEVIARYILNRPTIWAYDISKQAMCIMGALGGGYALLYNSHVKVDVFYSNWSIKKRAIADIITSILFFLFIITLTWKSFEMTTYSWIIKEHATTLFAPPIYHLKALITIGSLLLLLQGTAKLLRDIKVLITGEADEGRHMDFT